MSGYLPLTVLAEVVGDEVDALPWLARLLPETRAEAERYFTYWHGNIAEFERLRCEYAAGGHAALLEAIRFAAELGTPLPEWAATAYCAALDRYEQAEPSARTLGDAFGVHRTKSEHLNAARTRHLYLGWILRRHEALKLAGLRTAANAAGAPTIWEQISKELRDPRVLKSPDNPSPDEHMFTALQIFETPPRYIAPKEVGEMFYGSRGRVLPIKN